MVVGTGEGPIERLAQAVRAVLGQIEWMSLESAEMTKHALNGSWRSPSPTPTSWPGSANGSARTPRRSSAASEASRGSAGGPTSRGAAAGRRHAAQGRRVPGPARRRAGRCQPGRRRRPGQQSAPPGLVVHPSPGAAGRRRAASGGHPGPDLQAGDGHAAPIGIGGPGAGAPRSGRPDLGLRSAVRELPPSLGAITLAHEIDGALAGADVAILATLAAFRELTADQLVARCHRHG